ncbi:MAG: hypothetical protein ACI4BD_07385 [Paludibacteraceae bacterium]
MFFFFRIFASRLWHIPTPRTFGEGDGQADEGQYPRGLQADRAPRQSRETTACMPPKDGTRAEEGSGENKRKTGRRQRKRQRGEGKTKGRTRETTGEREDRGGGTDGNQ